jgi:preprotein translocase subunit SecE
MEKLSIAFKEYFDELLYKVNWPTIEELQNNTITVFIASLLIAFLIAVMDLVFRLGLQDGLYAFFSK